MPSRTRSHRRLLAAAALLLACSAAPADTVTVKITGIGGGLRDNVRKFLSIAAAGGGSLTERQIRRQHARARSEIRAALQPFGYYQPEIRASLKADGDNWQASYRIEPGPATTIDALDLRATGPGADNAAITKAIADSRLQTGQQLLHSDYKKTKAALIQAAYDAGYLDAAFKQARIRVHPQAARAEITLLLATGPRYYFGEVTIEQRILADRFVRRYLNFTPGDPFDADRLTQLQLALSDTEYFSQVEIEAQREQATGRRVPILIRATARKPQKYTARVGYGTDTGPRVGLGMEMRRLNRHGHQFRTDLRLSAIEQALSARYTIPIADVARDRLAFGATVKREELGDAVSDSYVLSVAREDGWQFGRRRLYLNLERENFDFGGNGRTADLFYPGVALTFQRADNSMHTRRGISMDADVHGGSDAVISSTNFIQATLGSKMVVPLVSKARLLMRAQLGATETDDFAALPPSQRFFAGGARSVRGYGYQSISPENADGDDIGGRYLATASVEAEYLFYGNFGAAAFFDVGDAAMDVTGLDAKRGVGVGLRWLSPVGTVRLDLAHPLDDPDNTLQIHFSLGPDL